MKKPISVFLIAMSLFWVIGISIVLFTDKLDFQSTLNSFNTPFLDQITPSLTHVGDGLFACGLVILMAVFFQKRSAMLLFMSYAGSSIITQILKRTLFIDSKRPMYYFDKVANYHKIDGLVYHYSNSFPSGHATTCFAIFTILAYLHAQTNLARILCFVFALLFSLTRVYLSQHFILDVIAGATIGYLTTLLILKLSENKFEKLEVPLFQRK
jgi:hypothetical protein